MNQRLTHLIQEELAIMGASHSSKAFGIVRDLLATMELMSRQYNFLTFSDDKLGRNRVTLHPRYIESGRLQLDNGTRKATIELSMYEKREGSLHLSLSVTAQKSLEERIAGSYKLMLEDSAAPHSLMMNIHAGFDAKNLEYFRENLGSLIELDKDLIGKVFLATLVYLNKEELL